MASFLVNWVPTPIGDGWDTEPAPVVWLDVKKIEGAFQQNAEQYVGKEGAGVGQRSRYDHVGRFIVSGRSVFMPHITIVKSKTVWFTDGRHRFAWIRDHGARAFPATTSTESVGGLESKFGAAVTECEVNL